MEFKQKTGKIRLEDGQMKRTFFMDMKFKVTDSGGCGNVLDDQGKVTGAWALRNGYLEVSEFKDFIYPDIFAEIKSIGFNTEEKQN